MKLKGQFRKRTHLPGTKRYKERTQLIDLFVTTRWKDDGSNDDLSSSLHLCSPSTRCLTEFVPWLCVRKSVSLMSFRSSFVIHEIRPNFPLPLPLPKANHCDLISAVPPGSPRIPNPLDNHVTKSISERICPWFYTISAPRWFSLSRKRMPHSSLDWKIEDFRRIFNLSERIIYINNG